MTKSEALALVATEWWQHATDREIAEFQMNEPRLCMPFERFQEAMEKALGRPVWTHEFGLDAAGLRSELMGERPVPTMADILSRIPAEKRVVMVIPEVTP